MADAYLIDMWTGRKLVHWFLPGGVIDPDYLDALERVVEYALLRDEREDRLDDYERNG